MFLVVLGDPTFGDFMDRYGVEVVQFLPAAPQGSDQVRFFQKFEMLGHRLPRHVEMFAQFCQ